MKLRMFTKQRGAHHEAILIIGAVVALVGTLGFVGYNTWQGQSANADVCATKNTKQARLKCLQEKVANINNRIGSLQHEINTHPKQPKQNTKRQNQINALAAERSGYQSRIDSLSQEIAAANATRPAPKSNKKIPQQQTNTNAKIGKDACQRVLGRVWSNNKCLEQCRPGAGTYVTSSQFGHCKFAAANLSASVCATKHRKFEYGVCERKWKGNLKPCEAGWGHYKKAKPLNYCRKHNKKTPPVSVKTGRLVEPGDSEGDDMYGDLEPETADELNDELPNENDPSEESDS